MGAQPTTTPTRRPAAAAWAGVALAAAVALPYLYGRGSGGMGWVGNTTDCGEGCARTVLAHQWVGAWPWYATTPIVALCGVAAVVGAGLLGTGPGSKVRSRVVVPAALLWAVLSPCVIALAIVGYGPAWPWWGVVAAIAGIGATLAAGAAAACCAAPG